MSSFLAQRDIAYYEYKNETSELVAELVQDRMLKLDQNGRASWINEQTDKTVIVFVIRDDLTFISNGDPSSFKTFPWE